MNKKINYFYSLEIKKFQDAIINKKINNAWYNLERAHILGQFFWKEHFYVHYLMFVLSLRTFNFKEAVGQIPRLLLAVPGSLLHKAPKGNVGTVRAGIFEPMSISDDLKKILDSCEIND